MIRVIAMLHISLAGINWLQILDFVETHWRDTSNMSVDSPLFHILSWSVMICHVCVQYNIGTPKKTDRVQFATIFVVETEFLWYVTYYKRCNIHIYIDIIHTYYACIVSYTSHFTRYLLLPSHLFPGSHYHQRRLAEKAADLKLEDEGGWGGSTLQVMLMIADSSC